MRESIVWAIVTMLWRCTTSSKALTYFLPPVRRRKRIPAGTRRTTIWAGHFTFRKRKLSQIWVTFRTWKRPFWPCYSTRSHLWTSWIVVWFKFRRTSREICTPMWCFLASRRWARWMRVWPFLIAEQVHWFKQKLIPPWKSWTKYLKKLY